MKANGRAIRFRILPLLLLPLLPAGAGAASPALAGAVDDLLGPAAVAGAAPAVAGYEEILADGSPAECLALGLALRGEGGRTNLVRAARLLHRAAKEGETDARYWLARMFEAGEGMKQPNPTKAFYWAWMGMEGTNTACMNLLGTYFEKGVGTTSDPVAAANYYRQAGDLGNAKGALNFALACEYGRGVPVDEPLALAYYESAARAGLAGAMFRAGLCHLYGTGTPRDGAAAAGWFLRGARAGDPDAAGFLGRCLARGIGVPRDPAEAAPWLEQAVSAGREDFRADLLRALREIPPDPANRGRIVARLEAAADGDPALCAAAIADRLADPAWGVPDLVAADAWLERGGPAARAAAHRARQRIARASFDAAAARAESAAHASETLVLRGLRLGMPAETAARLLEDAFADAGFQRELIVRPVPDGGVRAECDFAEIAGGEGEGSPVREIWLSRTAIDALFGTKGRSPDEARLSVLGATGALSRSEAREEDSAIVWEGRRIGSQKRIVHTSAEGWELVWQGALAVFDNRSLAPAREARAFRAAGSFTLRPAASAH